MSLNTIIEILDTYQREAAMNEPNYEVMVPGDVLDAMIEHLEKVNEPLSDIERILDHYDDLDTLSLTCPDAQMRPIIKQFVSDMLPHIMHHKF